MQGRWTLGLHISSFPYSKTEVPVSVGVAPLDLKHAANSASIVLDRGAWPYMRRSSTQSSSGTRINRQEEPPTPKSPLWVPWRCLL
jgi:hypothetical protein